MPCVSPSLQGRQVSVDMMAVVSGEIIGFGAFREGWGLDEDILDVMRRFVEIYGKWE